VKRVTPEDDGLGYPEGDVAVAVERLGRLIAGLPSLTREEVVAALEAEQLTLAAAAEVLEHRRAAEGSRRRELERAVRARCARCQSHENGLPTWFWRRCECRVDCGLPGCEFRKRGD
jgi:hypothetical protein